MIRVCDVLEGRVVFLSRVGTVLCSERFALALFGLFLVRRLILFPGLSSDSHLFESSLPGFFEPVVWIVSDSATDPFPWSVVGDASVRKLFAWLFRAYCLDCF